MYRYKVIKLTNITKILSLNVQWHTTNYQTSEIDKSQIDEMILSKGTSCETIRRFDIYLAERQVIKDIGAEVKR